MPEKGFLYRNLPNPDTFCEVSRSSVHHSTKYLTATAAAYHKPFYFLCHFSFLSLCLSVSLSHIDTCTIFFFLFLMLYFSAKRSLLAIPYTNFKG